MRNLSPKRRKDSRHLASFNLASLASEAVLGTHFSELRLVSETEKARMTFRRQPGLRSLSRNIIWAVQRHVSASTPRPLQCDRYLRTAYRDQQTTMSDLLTANIVTNR